MDDNPVNRVPRVAGVILAAGASLRMGKAKLLLPWREKPLIHWVVTAALDSGLDQVMVVTGKYHAEVMQALQGTEAKFIHNPDWEMGQSTSVRAAILSLPPEIDAVIFFLGDQPKIPVPAVIQMIEFYSRSVPRLYILAPTVLGKRGNPVLFDRQVFQDLLELKGDSGARQLFGKYEPIFLEFDEPGMLFDIDSPEDYQALIT